MNLKKYNRKYVEIHLEDGSVFSGEAMNFDKLEDDIYPENGLIIFGESGGDRIYLESEIKKVEIIKEPAK